VSEANERILLADDEEALRFVLGAQLRSSGYEVALASDGREAINLVRDQEFPVIVTDMRMPEASGLDVMREAKDRWPRTEVIVLTAYGSMENVIDALQAGNLFHYLTKPLGDVREVSVVVERALERRRLRAENVRLGTELGQAFERLRDNSQQLVQAGKLAGVGRLINTLARGISNPLESVLGLVSYLNGKLSSANWEQLSAEDRERILAGLSRVDEAARQCTGVVGTLLRYTERDDGSFRDLDVNAVLRDTLLLAESEVLQAGVELRTHFSADLPAVSGSPVRLQQVFTSLVLSALEVTPRGGSMLITTARKEGKPPSAVVEITHAGDGTASQLLSQGEAADGLALGLSVSRSIVEEHRGRLAVESDGAVPRIVLVLPGLGEERLPVEGSRVA
jgi:CheY-like chemotaxis protein